MSIEASLLTPKMTVNLALLSRMTVKTVFLTVRASLYILCQYPFII